jgi:hypothetical protein
MEEVIPNYFKLNFDSLVIIFIDDKVLGVVLLAAQIILQWMDWVEIKSMVYYSENDIVSFVS